MGFLWFVCEFAFFYNPLFKILSEELMECYLFPVIYIHALLLFCSWQMPLVIAWTSPRPVKPYSPWK